MLGELKESRNGGFKGYSKKHNWTHKSYLWELPYEKALILPHNIDLMHQEQNVVKSIMRMCLKYLAACEEDMAFMDTTTSSCSEMKTSYKYGKLVLMFFH